MSLPKLILYSYARSSCSWRVRAVLDHKKIPFEYRPVSIYGKETHTEEFKKVNPAEMIPVLLVPTPDGQYKTLFESLAIIDYLERTYPQHPVYPNDPFVRANALAIAEMITSGIQPLQNLGVMQYAAEFAGAADKARALDWGQHWIRVKFEQLEKILSTLSGKYTVGDQFSLADICLVPQVFNAYRYGVDVTPYPLIKRLYEQLMASEEAIISSRPDKQIDFDDQKEKKLAGY